MPLFIHTLVRFTYIVRIIDIDIIQPMKTIKSTEPLREHIIPFLEYCEIEKGLSDNTQRNYQQYLKLFTDWLKKTENENLLPYALTTNRIWD